jgi:Zn-dependent M28 family amino/carboxypeptidase
MSAPAPGADDNGTGSAGLLQLADALSDRCHEHDLRFLLTGGEEQGLIGSRRYLATLTDEERGRIKAVINMDMIGLKNTVAPTVLLEGDPISQHIVRALAETAAAYAPDLRIQTSLAPYASDHFQFIEAGVPAVLTIEGADAKSEGIVHSARDTVDKIDEALANLILRMNAAYLAQALGMNEPC